MNVKYHFIWTLLAALTFQGAADFLDDPRSNILDDIDVMIERDLTSMEDDLNTARTFQNFLILEGENTQNAENTIEMIEREIADLEQLLGTLVVDPDDVEVSPDIEQNQVDVYVVDSGIDFTHPEFDDVPKEHGIDFVGGALHDYHFRHGTHIASTIAGVNVGISKNVKLIDVRVLDSAGYSTVNNLLAAFYWIAQRYAANPARPAIINVSLTGPQNQLLERVVAKVLEMGIHVVTAAGNAGVDACQFTPGRVPGVITVASTDERYSRVDSSNYGPCVTTYAHGQCLYTASPGGEYKRKCGTSLAASVATGVLAEYLSSDPVNGIANFHDNLGAGIVRNNPDTTPNKYVIASLMAV